MIKAKNFILASDKLEKEYLLVEVSNWNDYETQAHMGFYYQVLFPKLQSEKIKIAIKGEKPYVTNEELCKSGGVWVKFNNLTVQGSMYNGVFSAKGFADSLQFVENQGKQLIDVITLQRPARAALAESVQERCIR